MQPRLFDPLANRLAVGSNSRTSSLTQRPALANSMMRRRYPARIVDGFAAFGGISSFCPTPSMKSGQLQVSASGHISLDDYEELVQYVTEIKAHVGRASPKAEC